MIWIHINVTGLSNEFASKYKPLGSVYLKNAFGAQIMLVNSHMLFKVTEKLLQKWDLTCPLYTRTVLSQSFLTGDINVLYCPMYVI